MAVLFPKPIPFLSACLLDYVANLRKIRENAKKKSCVFATFGYLYTSIIINPDYFLEKTKNNNQKKKGLI